MSGQRTDGSQPSRRGERDLAGELADALARVTSGARHRRALTMGLTAGIAAAGGSAAWWGLTGGHAVRVAAYGIVAFAFVVQLIVTTVLAERIGRETEHVAREASL